MKLLEIYRHPVKSFGGELLDAAELHDLGVKGDRRFMLIDAAGRFVSARERPMLLCWRALWLDELRVRLIAPSGAAIIATPGTEAISVQVWSDRFDAVLCDDKTQTWLAETMGPELRLVFMPDQSPRPVDAAYGAPGDVVAFADGFPLLVLSDASMQHLNESAAEVLSIRRFRPNLVISANAPHAEDHWRRIQIGDCEIELVKPCVRCVLTTLDPDSGDAHLAKQPLHALKCYRRTAKGVTFGMNALVRRAGRVRLGDPVQILG